MRIVCLCQHIKYAVYLHVICLRFVCYANTKRMSNEQTIGDRVKLLIDRKGITQAVLAEVLQITAGSLSNALSRSNAQWERWKDIAEYFGSPVDWLIAGDAPKPWEASDAETMHTAADDAPRTRSGPASNRVDYGPRIAVVGQVTAGGGWAFGEDGGVGLWLELKPRWRAVRVEGRSAEPVILDGQCALVDDELKPKNGRIVCVQTTDGRAFLKRYHAIGDDLVVLAGLNAGQDSVAIKQEEIEHISVVVGTVFTDSVAR
jgi:phage repressor protein C with HTH and peptisase S24 domain